MRNAGAFDLPTPRGPARVVLDVPSGQTNGTAVLFHGAGGGMDAAVLVAVRDALVDAGWAVARLDQPYRVAGRRAPAPAPHLDEVALLAVAEVRGRGGPLLLAGKSSGARVACRVATACGAAGVVALGFPLHPPGRPDKTRAPELNAAGVPVLVLQGGRDAFGRPDEVRAVAGPHVTVHEVPGDHAMRTVAAVTEAAERAQEFAQART